MRQRLLNSKCAYRFFYRLLLIIAAPDHIQLFLSTFYSPARYSQGRRELRKNRLKGVSSFLGRGKTHSCENGSYDAPIVILTPNGREMHPGLSQSFLLISTCLRCAESLVIDTVGCSSKEFCSTHCLAPICRWNA